MLRRLEIYQGAYSTKAYSLPRFMTRIWYPGWICLGSNLQTAFCKNMSKERSTEATKMERNATYRVLPHELEQEHAQGKDESTDACEAHCGGGTHRGTLWRRGVALACGGTVVRASPPSMAYGGVVSQSSSPGARCIQREARERGNGKVRGRKGP